MKDFLPPNIYQATYDVAPDGQHFVMGRRLVADNGERLIIIDGFLQQLSEIVAR